MPRSDTLLAGNSPDIGDICLMAGPKWEMVNIFVWNPSSNLL